MTRCSS